MTEPETKTTVHILREGRALCGRPGVVGEWPHTERWLSFETVDNADLDAGAVLCEPCKHIHENGTRPPRLGYTVLVGDRTGKVMTTWCQTCGQSFTFHAPCSIPMFSAIAKQFEREHRRCK